MATADDVRQMATDEAAKVLAAKKGAQPTPAPVPTKPVATPMAGMGAKSALKPKTAPLAGAEAKKAMGIDDVMSRFDSSSKQIMDLNKQQLAEHPLPREPLKQFTPEHTKEISVLTSMLMVMGALAGRRTMAPATAALNNMTGILTGIKQGRDDVYQKNLAEYKENFKVANENYNRVLEERKQIMESSKGDLKAEQDNMKMFFLREGISEKYFKDQISHDNGMLRHKDAVVKQNDTVINNVLHPTLLNDAKPAKGSSADVTRLNLERDKEIAKSPKRAAEINARFDQQIAALGGGAAAAAPSGKPTPTQADIDYVKAHPETKAAFVAHFGVEP
jgi:hypothetical protein